MHTCSRTARRAVILVALVCAAAVPAVAATTVQAYPVVPSIVVGIAAAAVTPEAPPPGADVGCRPSAAHPYPVVLANGTFSSMLDDFGGLAPTLANAGYCVYTVNYGEPFRGSLVQSVGPVVDSARAFASYVDQVLASTGASKVDLVGHSQGGLVVEYYAKLLGGAPKVHALVALSPTTHGTTLSGLATLGRVFGITSLVGYACPACTDQLPDSPVVAALDAGPIAQPGVSYTVIETRNESVVTPVGSAFIREPGVTNRYVQSDCPLDLVDHVNLPYDRVVIREVRNALDPATARRPNCFQAFPYPA